MSHILDREAWERYGKPGDWYFFEPWEKDPTRRIGIHLTEADDGICILPIVTQGDYADPTLASAHWYWNGDREAPTLEPSILHHSKVEWHGYLRGGKLEVV